MSEAIERVRDWVDYWVNNRAVPMPTRPSVIDLRELLAGYIPPEHHAAIRAALNSEVHILSTPESDTSRFRAALAAMPKAGA